MGLRLERMRKCRVVEDVWEKDLDLGNLHLGGVVGPFGPSRSGNRVGCRLLGRSDSSPWRADYAEWLGYEVIGDRNEMRAALMLFIISGMKCGTRV